MLPLFFRIDNSLLANATSRADRERVEYALGVAVQSVVPQPSFWQEVVCACEVGFAAICAPVADVDGGLLSKSD
jgi:hypothetical protein